MLFIALSIITIAMIFHILFPSNMLASLAKSSDNQALIAGLIMLIYSVPCFIILCMYCRTAIAYAFIMCDLYMAIVTIVLIISYVIINRYKSLNKC